jgi:subtilisin family serine protease
MHSTVPIPDEATFTGTIDTYVKEESLDLPEVAAKLSNDDNDKLTRSNLLYDFVKVWLDARGEGVRVAVIDTGIDKKHPAFPASSIVRAVSVLDDRIDDRDCAAQDMNGHGTHCAGIIAARPLGVNGSGWVAYQPSAPKTPAGGAAAVASGAGYGAPELQTGWGGIMWEPALAKLTASTPASGTTFDRLGVRFCGVAPAAQLMIYKVTRDDSRSARMNDVALAINTAVDDGADVISISIQGDYGTDALYFAVQRALAKRKMIITSAGNRGQLRPVNIGYPARYGGVITVAAHNRFGQPSGFSSAGGEIDVSAPGESVWSTWTGRGYRSQSGTSMAAPWVAGIAALILSKHKQQTGNATPVRHCEELREHLLRMASHLGQYDPKEGYGPLWPGNYFARETV